MTSRIALLLPLAALVLIAAMASVVLLSSGDAPAAPASSTGSEASATPAQQAQSQHSASVCQGVLARPDPSAPRQFADIYTQKRDARGITIVADAHVDPDALDVAVRTVETVFAHNNLIDSLVSEGAYIIVADQDQGVLDLPEFGCLEDELGSEFFTHVCGVADRADYPVATVNELDLLGSRRGPCGGLNVLFHEVGHLVQGWTLDHADYIDVKLDYQAALNAGKYRGDYASTNANEYFAEATQAYFHHVRNDGSRDRDWLQTYDPAIYELLKKVYGQ